MRRKNNHVVDAPELSPHDDALRHFPNYEEW
jgi:hypothetical protein